MTGEKRSRREVSHARRQPIRHQIPELSNYPCVRLRRRRHQLVRVVAVHHAVVVPAAPADKHLREMGQSRLEVLESVRQLEELRYRHGPGANGVCRCQETLERHVADVVVRCALALELSDGSGEPIGFVAGYAVVGHFERHAQESISAAGLHSVLPALVHVVARSRRKGQVFEGLPESLPEASGELQGDVWKRVVYQRGVDNGECVDLDFDSVETFQDWLGFVVAFFAGAEDL